MKKILTILIVLCAICCFGCKDKAEAESGTFSLESFEYIDANASDFTTLKDSVCSYLYPIADPKLDWMNYSFDIIPTWPEYIELEKDMMYFIPDDNNSSTVGDGIECELMPKGTKIYFRENKK